MTLKTQKQTTFGSVGEREDAGNCFSTCIASMLGLDTSQVPNFCSLKEDIWWEEAVKWMRQRNLDLVDIKSLGQMVCSPGFTFIASGPSPRFDCDHSVICRVNDAMEFEIIMDPHPDGTGLAGPFKSACFITLYLEVQNDSRF